MKGVDQGRARGLFFVVLQGEIPEVFDDLAGEPFEAYSAHQRKSEELQKENERRQDAAGGDVLTLFRELFEAFDFWLVGQHIESVRTMAEAETIKAHLDEAMDELEGLFEKRPSDAFLTLRRLGAERVHAIREWRERWGLSPAWCQDIANGVLAEWYHEPRLRAERRLPPEVSTVGHIALHGFIMRPEDEPVPRIALAEDQAGWRFSEESRTVARRRLLNAAQKEIDAYLDRVEQLASERQFRVKRNFKADLQLLIRARIASPQVSVSQLAREAKTDRAAIRRRIYSAAEFIGFPLSADSLSESSTTPAN